MGKMALFRVTTQVGQSSLNPALYAAPYDDGFFFCWLCGSLLENRLFYNSRTLPQVCILLNSHRANQLNINK